MNAPFNIRQLAQYPRTDAAIPGTVMLMQMGELGSPYASILTSNLVTSALAAGGNFNLAAGNSSINFLFDQGAGSVTLSVENGELLVTPALRSSQVNATFVNTSGVFVNGIPAATQADLSASRAQSVTSFNLRTGDVMLMPEDILRAGGAPIRDAHFGGWITAPSVWDTRSDDDTVATTNWVHRAIHDTGVCSFNGRTGCVVLQTSDVNAAYAVPGPPFPTSSNPVLGDASNRIATTLFVDESMADLEDRLIAELGEPDLSGFAPLNSPDFTGIPLAPTANPGTSTGQIATTAFVQHAITAGTAGVSSFNTRTGAVTLLLADVTGAGGAPLASPALSGTPTAPTAAPSTSTTQIATTAFVQAAITSIGAGVTSFNARTGAVTLTTADVTGAGGAPIAGPSFTGTVTAPTPAPATNNTQVATTAYVTAAITAAGGGVSSFNSRTGAVTLLNADISAAGGALISSPTFTGVPAAPTATPGTATTQLATTAFVAAAIAAGTAGVTSFNTRTGAVTLTTADVTGAGGAPIASPALTGVPTAPTAVGTSNDTTVATTAFVKAAITSASGVTSFNTRVGAVTLTSADVSAAGGALIASPTFTGTPAAPTAVPGTSTTQIATTAFVTAALASGVASFNGRNGAVTLTAADITGAGGALLASPTFTGTPNAPTPTAGTSNTQIATTAFVAAAVAASGTTPGWTFALNSGVSTQTATNPAVLNLNGGTATWNPSDILAVTLSNGNLTATCAASGSPGCRAISGISSGKYYFEYTLVSGVGSFGYGLASLATPLGTAFNQAGTVGVPGSLGNIFVNGSLSSGSIGARSAGDVIGVAIDCTAQLIWFRVSPAGQWNGSGTANPATGAGGISLSPLVFPLYPYIGLNSPSSGTVTTANFGASAFSGAVPSGFGNVTAVDYQINNKNAGGIVQIRDNTAESAAPANYLTFSNNISGQPSIITTSGSDTNRSIQLVPIGTGTVQAPTMAVGNNSTAIATTAFVAANALTHGVLAIQVFNVAGTATYTPTAGMKSCLIEAVGGGAGGCGKSGVASTYNFGGGGGSGAYSRKFATSAMIGASQVVTIGAGGTGGTGTPTVGNPGGDTSVGTICVARGAASPTSVNGPSSGGLATGTGDYQAQGSPGGLGAQITTAQGFFAAGAGGSSLLGAGATQSMWTATTATGSAAPGYGGGGGGGSIGTTGGVAGGAGASGVVIITEFG